MKEVNFENKKIVLKKDLVLKKTEITRTMFQFIFDSGDIDPEIKYKVLETHMDKATDSMLVNGLAAQFKANEMDFEDIAKLRHYRLKKACQQTIPYTKIIQKLFSLYKNEGLEGAEKQQAQIDLLKRCSDRDQATILKDIYQSSIYEELMYVVFSDSTELKCPFEEISDLQRLKENFCKTTTVGE